MLVYAYYIRAWESKEFNHYDDFCDILNCLGSRYMDDWDSDSRTIWVKTPAGIVKAEAGDTIVVRDGIAEVYKLKIADVTYGLETDNR
jgi:hypothetical protein